MSLRTFEEVLEDMRARPWAMECSDLLAELAVVVGDADLEMRDQVCMLSNLIAYGTSMPPGASWNHGGGS